MTTSLNALMFKWSREIVIVVLYVCGLDLHVLRSDHCEIQIPTNDLYLLTVNFLPHFIYSGFSYCNAVCLNGHYRLFPQLKQIQLFLRSYMLLLWRIPSEDPRTLRTNAEVGLEKIDFSSHGENGCGWGKPARPQSWCLQTEKQRAQTWQASDEGRDWKG